MAYSLTLYTTVIVLYVGMIYFLYRQIHYSSLNTFESECNVLYLFVLFVTLLYNVFIHVFVLASVLIHIAYFNINIIKL